MAEAITSREVDTTREVDGAAARDIRPDELRFDANGLVPAIVQEHQTGEVLMMAWMTRDTLVETMDRGETVFWSRSRSERWHKGATSGAVQRVVDVTADCDADVVLVRVRQEDPGACHTGAWTCFHRPFATGARDVHGGVTRAVEAQGSPDPPPSEDEDPDEDGGAPPVTPEQDEPGEPSS